MHWLALWWPPEPPEPQAPAMPAPEALGWWALRFTPHVAWLDEALLLEVAACERLWGGRQALMRQMAAENPAPVPVRRVQGATSLVALARLRLYAAGQRPPQQLPAALPLWTLTAARPHLDVLARMGCHTWGQAAALPRGGLARRFGPGLREALDIAWGLRPERHAWLTLPETFSQRIELPALATRAPELLWAAQRLLAGLRLWLQARQRGVLAFALEWTLDLKRLNGVDLPRRQQLVVRTAEPTQDMAHLRRLLAERLALTQLAAPTGWLRLHVLETAPWAGAARSFLPEDNRPGEPLHQLVEKLSARLGPQRVLRARPQADHRPERMQAWVPAVQAPPAAAPAQEGPGTGLLPAWLLREPVALELREGHPQFHGPLRRLAGPQRLEGDGWWEEGEPARRDYYVAESPGAGLVWVYCERASAGMPGQAPRWFLQGLYA
ncbi:DNA polymerase Y family protein [Xenophilus sp.]|uniref:DNA polymerase Y family protein n=1 Tax=Xenophilus sp. TaxID=1873499 RepID=UPI0037DC485F